MKKITYIILLLICVTAQSARATSNEIKDKEYILVLSSINFSEVWSHNFYEVLKKEFGNEIPVYGEELMLPMVHDAAQVTRLRDSLANKYENPPKLVVFIGDPGWIAMKPLFDNKWKDVPVILCYSREQVPNSIETLISSDKGISSQIDRKESIKGYDVTTIEQPFFILNTIDLMKHLLPGMNKIVFIHDQRYISLSVREELKNIVKQDFPELKLEYLSSPEISSEKLLDTISRHDANTGIIYYSWFKTTQDGEQQYLNDHIQKVLFGFANTPVFTLADQNPESGNFAGGYFISIDDVGKVVVDIAKSILGGKDHEREIMFDITNATKYLNYSHLQHHNVDPALYPKDAVYFQAPPSPFAKYKVRIISLLAVFVITLTICIFIALLYMQKNRRREIELKLSAQYRQMVKNMPVPYLRKELIRNSNGVVSDIRLTDMNPAFEKLMQCSQEQIKGKKLVEAAHLCMDLQKINDKKGEDGYDLYLTDENGNKTYYDQLEFSDDNQNIVETFFINKTDSYREKKRTEEYYTFLQSILDNLPIATKVNDMNNDLQCIYWNKKAAEMFDSTAMDIRNNAFGDISDSEENDEIDTINNTISAHWEGIRKYTQKNGKKHSFLVTRHQLDHMDNKKWLLSSAMDITEMQENRLMLEYLNNNYKLVLHSTRLIMLSWDIPKGLLYGNASYADTTFFNQGDRFTVPEAAFFNNIHPDDLKSVRSLFDQLINGVIDTIDHEYRLMDLESGHYRWVNGYATVGERDENGKTISIVGAIRDIDEHKLMEMELKRAKEKADESNRLKSAFLANMSHEIRTPLNAIVGFSNLLTKTKDENEKRDYLKIIETNNTLLLQLIGDILDISKIESGSLEFVYSNVNIYALCNEVFQAAKLRLNKKNVTLSFDEYIPSLIVRSDRNRLMQLLNNFLTNAMKFTQNGTIKMGFRLQDDNSIYFYVSDSGCGIPRDKQKAIFGRFVKLNSFAQGTGLGLSICETIVEKLGGTIGVESELSKGSTFWFTIPNIRPEKNEAPETPEKHEVCTPKHPHERTILIAEDDESNYRLFESILKNDYRLIHAWDGLEAVELFKEHNPDLVIMDLKMPIMDGYAATEQIRKLSKTAVIVAATAYAFAEDEQRVQEKGFNGYIPKPINTNLLKPRINRLLSKN